MSQIMVIATIKLNNKNLLDDWNVLSKKISDDLEGQDGFISRDVVRKDNRTILCLLKWESKAQQQKFMAEIAERTDLVTEMIMNEFERVVDAANIKQEFLEILA